MPDGPAQSVINILKKEQEQYTSSTNIKNSATSSVTIPEKVTTTTGSQNESGDWVVVETEKSPPISRSDPEQDAYEELKAKPESFRQFCKTIDDRIIAFNAQINNKKQQIVTLSTEATQGNCWPGIAASVTTSGGTTRSTPSITQTYYTNTTYNQDRDLLSIYTTMDGPNPNYDAVNPFDPDSTVGLAATNSGYGRANTKDDNGGANIGNARLDISSTLADHNARTISLVAPFRYYFGAGVAPDATNTSVTASRCVTIQQTIATLVAEITALRTQRDALRTDLNTIKAEKANKDLAAWGLISQQKKVDAQKTSKASIITAITNLSP